MLVQFIISGPDILHPESQSTKKNSANLWGNYDETYDEIMM
jgi:hypothetical protein